MNQQPIQPSSFAFPASFTPEKRQELFEEIVRLYDLADNALALVQRDKVPNRDVQLELLTPFVTQVINSANILSAFYNEVVNKNLPITPDLQDTFESAFRNIFYAYKEFIDGAEAKLLPKGV